MTRRIDQISVYSGTFVSGSPSNGVTDAFQKGVGLMCGERGWVRIAEGWDRRCVQYNFSTWGAHLSCYNESHITQYIMLIYYVYFLAIVI